jgi:hypothetical protein
VHEKSITPPLSRNVSNHCHTLTGEAASAAITEKIGKNKNNHRKIFFIPSYQE